ncbi:hypothetical protein V8D89_012107 [Ganoderma adspersum]
MNCFNKVLDTFSTVAVNPMYYVGFSTTTIVVSVILFQGFNTDDPANSIFLLVGFITTFPPRDLPQTRPILYTWRAPPHCARGRADEPPPEHTRPHVDRRMERGSEDPYREHNTDTMQTLFQVFEEDDDERGADSLGLDMLREVEDDELKANEWTALRLGRRFGNGKHGSLPQSHSGNNTYPQRDALATHMMQGSVMRQTLFWRWHMSA